MPLPFSIDRFLQAPFSFFTLRILPERSTNSLTAVPVVANMLNKLSGQPETYEKKYVRLILSSVVLHSLTLVLGLSTSSGERWVQAPTALSARRKTPMEKGSRSRSF